MGYAEDRIRVIDSYPGSGKTLFAIQSINESDNRTKIIYITPFLKEVDRIIDSCPNKGFIQPDPTKGRGSKASHLYQLILEGKNIVSTHSLFSMINDEMIDVLRGKDYILYLDEVFQCVLKYEVINEDIEREKKDAITRKDINTLLTNELIKIEDDYRITWLDNTHLLYKYKKLTDLANRQLLYYVDGLLLWSFPIKVFNPGIFSEIFILTHQFDYQLQAYYYKYFGLEYSKYHVIKDSDRYRIEKTLNDDYEIEWKRHIKEKIDIIDNPKLNGIGDEYRDARKHAYGAALSVNWFRKHKGKNSPEIEQLRKNISNYFKHYTVNKASERLWTCFKDDISRLKSRDISSKYWLAFNWRATNDYSDKSHLAYVINRYLDPSYRKYFVKKNIFIYQDRNALSELLQWIFRSAIRNDKEITLYIPSERMRTLLKKYLNNEEISF